MAVSTRLSIRHYDAAHGSHAHDHFQVLVGLQGVLDLEVEGRGRRVAAGEGLVVAPGDRHDFEAARGSLCLVLDSAHASWGRLPAIPRQPGQVHALAQYLAQALDSASPLARLHGPTLLLEAWAPAEAPQRARRRIDWEALGAWVQLRLHEPLTVAQLAERALLSASQFSLRCHDAHGMSPHDWLRVQRLERARQLRALGMPVAEVARRTGYRSPSALTAALRRSGLR